MSEGRTFSLKGFDPLRTAMLYTPSRTQAGLICALLCAAFFALALALCGGMQGAAVIAAVGTLCLALLMLGAAYAMKGRAFPVLLWLCVGALAMLAVGAHLAMLDITPGRYTKILEPLLSDMWNYELGTAMAWEDDGWSGLYLIVCALISRLENFPWLYALKLVDLVCQCLCALAVARLAKMRGARTEGMLCAMLAAVLAPTMLLNAGCWVQCDATFAMLALWGLAMLLDEHPLAGCVLLGAAVSAKLQSAFLFPLLIVCFMRGRVSLRHLLALALSALVCHAPILTEGYGLYSVVHRYAMQLETARETIGLTDHGAGIFGLMKVASVREFSGLGLYLGIACALLVVLAMLRSRAPLTRRDMLLGALLLAAGLPLVLPQVNARSLYLALMLSFAMAGGVRLTAAALLLELVSLCSYMAAIFSHEIMPISVLSLLAIAAAVLVALELVARLQGGAAHACAEEGEA